jgi:hypothetical protein
MRRKEGPGDNLAFLIRLGVLSDGGGQTGWGFALLATLFELDTFVLFTDMALDQRPLLDDLVVD